LGDGGSRAHHYLSDEHGNLIEMANNSKKIKTNVPSYTNMASAHLRQAPNIENLIRMQQQQQQYQQNQIFSQQQLSPMYNVFNDSIGAMSSDNVVFGNGMHGALSPQHANHQPPLSS